MMIIQCMIFPLMWNIHIKIPYIKIGNIKRTLIFPHGIVNNLKKKFG